MARLRREVEGAGSAPPTRFRRVAAASARARIVDSVRRLGGAKPRSARGVRELIQIIPRGDRPKRDDSDRLMGSSQIGHKGYSLRSTCARLRTWWISQRRLPRGFRAIVPSQDRRAAGGKGKLSLRKHLRIDIRGQV